MSVDAGARCYPSAVGERTTLELVGVVSHSGMLKSGHYVAYVKRVGHVVERNEAAEETAAEETAAEETAAEEDTDKVVTDGMQAVSLEDHVDGESATPAERVEQWYYVSDTHVNKVSVAQVLACEAYVLFYARQ